MANRTKSEGPPSCADHWRGRLSRTREIRLRPCLWWSPRVPLQPRRLGPGYSLRIARVIVNSNHERSINMFVTVDASLEKYPRRPRLDGVGWLRRRLTPKTCAPLEQAQSSVAVAVAAYRLPTTSSAHLEASRYSSGRSTSDSVTGDPAKFSICSATSSLAPIVPS